MYLYHFGLQRLPFGLTPDTSYFCELPGHRAALNVLQVALASGEGFIKITGEVGTGKTLLCRKLLVDLERRPEARRPHCAYIPNPVLNPHELRLALAHELGMKLPAKESQALLAKRLELRLLEIAREQRPVILLIDEAQALPDASLEALRLLSNLETERQKLLQIVLVGQPELNVRLATDRFRQLRQRIAFSHHLPALTTPQMKAYISYRLQIAGRKGTIPFSNTALYWLARASRGIPRLGHILAHKALLAAYGKGLSCAGWPQLWAAIRDTEDVNLRLLRLGKITLAGGFGLMLAGAAAAAGFWSDALWR